MPIQWFEIVTTPPPFGIKLLTKGIESGIRVKWNNNTKSYEDGEPYAWSWFDIGVFKESTDGSPRYYDSAAISSDKNSYELWNEIKPPTHWAYLDNEEETSKCQK